jgi:hypothetical protein
MLQTIQQPTKGYFVKVSDVFGEQFHTFDSKEMAEMFFKKVMNELPKKKAVGKKKLVSLNPIM